MFVKGDPRINRDGRPKAGESKKDKLWDALVKEGKVRNTNPFDRIAHLFYEEDRSTVAVLKKFVADMNITDIEGHLIVNQLPIVKVDGVPLIPELGEPVDDGES